MLKFIGNGDDYNYKLGNNSSFIKERDYLFLIDCGKTVFDGILKLSLLDNIKEVYALITHIHHDHVGSLHSLIEHNYNNNIKTTVMHPTSDVMSVLSKDSINREMFSYISPEDFKYFDIKSHITKHIKYLNAFGYTLFKDNQRIYYSGDTCIIPPKILQELLQGKFDIAYFDTCSLDEGYCASINYPHLSVETLEKAIPANLRNKIWCMHLDELFDVQRVKKLGFNVVENEFQKRAKKKERDIFEF